MKRMNKWIFMIGATCMLSSCGIYSTYKPQTSVPENLYGEEFLAKDTVSLGNLEWRELFKDPQLQALIERGLQNNTDLRTAQLRVEEAKAALLAAKLSFLPSLAFSPQGTISSFDGETSKTYTVPVSASWELDIFGKLRNAKKQAQAAYEQSEDYQQAVHSSLIANIANTYYTLLMLDEQLAISEKTAVSWKETVQSTEALMNAGLANESAVSQMKATYFEVENSVLDLKEQINQAENSLALLLAESPQSFDRGRLAEVVIAHDHGRVGCVRQRGIVFRCAPLELQINGVDKPGLGNAAHELQIVSFFGEKAALGFRSEGKKHGLFNALLEFERCGDEAVDFGSAEEVSAPLQDVCRLLLIVERRLNQIRNRRSHDACQNFDGLRTEQDGSDACGLFGIG